MSTSITSQSVKIRAFHLGDQLNLKPFRDDYTGKLETASSSELFYTIEDGFALIFNYGVAVFANISDAEMSKTIGFLQKYLVNPVESKISEDYIVKLAPDQEVVFGFDFLYSPVINRDLIRVVMLNLAQSVSLDYYAHASEKLLTEVKRFTTELELEGRISISKKNMLKFIGKSLSNKNQIVENLYIFDAPDMVWDNEFLEKLNTGFRQFFDTKGRFREVEYTIRIIDDNLKVLRELHLHGESNRLEWIIMVLILIEVVNLFLDRFLALLFH